MSVPIPKPRGISLEKKPIPLPRKMIEKPTVPSQTEPTNTFTRKVKQLGSTSKQITDEISDRVQETGKAVMESTRQSVRKITRKFSSASEQTERSPDNRTVSQCSTADSDIFDSIQFQSPLDSSNSDSDESVSLPPPNHPPPPLPDTSMYDQPQSLKRPAKPKVNRDAYEAVFPILPPPMSSSDSDPPSNDATRTNSISPGVTSRGSWTFYDPVTLNDSNEVIYDNIRSSNSSSCSELNLLYENHILELHKRNNESSQSTRVSKSTIIEFDPLMSQPDNVISMREKLCMFGFDDEQVNDIYSFDTWSISEGSETDESLVAPAPPRRFDSLADESLPVSKSPSNSQFYVKEPKQEAPPESKTMLGKFNLLKKVVTEGANKLRGSLHKDKDLEFPMVNTRTEVYHKGTLFTVKSKGVEDLFGELHFRHCVLQNGMFTCYSDSTCTNIKEQIPLVSILNISLTPPKRYKFEVDMYCFELILTGRGRGSHVFGCGRKPDCRDWMRRIAEALTNRFPLNNVCDYKRLGLAYFRESVSGPWAGAWVMLSKRSLYYANDDAPMGTVDLRKARCIQLQDMESDSPKTADKGPNLVVDCPNGALYLRIWTAKQTKFWCAFIQREAYSNGKSIEEQQLTKDNVPVLVEKCVNFIYANGSMSEGIYRRSGSSTVIAGILAQFHSNAWAVTLTRDKCSEHDVANVLKRFLRNLSEPLLPIEKSEMLCTISDNFQSTSEKVNLYKNILDQFSTVVYSTLRRLLGHLYFIQSQSEKNKMSVDNLASIWGPTLVHHDGMEQQWSATEVNLTSQLIMMYQQLFSVSEEELDRERRMLQVLERCNVGQGPAHVRVSGDLRVAVHLWDKNGEPVIITVGPQKLAADISMEMSSRMKTPAYDLQLEELVLNGCLRRPIHYSEKVLEVVLRWSYWDEADRKDNCLILTSITKYKQFDKPATTNLTLNEELKFADNKSKQFKVHTFKFEQAKLSCYKDKNANVKMLEWNIKDLVWYFGHERGKDPQTKWSLTFILRRNPPNRSNGCPYFGNTIAGNELNSRINWISMMIRSEHPNGLFPRLMPLE